MLKSFLQNFMRKDNGASPSGDFDAALAQGIAALDGNDLPAACRHLRAALDARPDSYDAAYHLAIAQAQSGQPATAETLLLTARALRDGADVNNALGNVRRLLGRLEDAATDYRRALEHDRTLLPVLANLGLTLRDLGKPREALEVLERATELAPDHVETLFNRALALNDLGESMAAEELVERSLRIDPQFAQAHLQRAFTLLKRRDFAKGWREYAWRVRIPEVDHWQDYAFPMWEGESLAGKRLLVQTEQGLGDQIMFGSCLREVIDRAQDVVIECDPRLAKLFARSFPGATIYRHRIEGKPDWQHEAPFDFRARCGDLPRMLRNAESEFPQHDGYLVADAARIEYWQDRLAALGPGLKIGLSWRGGTPATGEKLRSIELEKLLPSVARPGAQFISLQYGKIAREIAAVRERHDINVHEWVSADGALDDFAALLSSLDVVITVCTTTAHLAGALGKQTWVMVPAVAEWRYLAEGAQIPWYPALRLFRQQRLHDWDDVISAIAKSLAERMTR